ncbi:acetylglutamate kinase [Candidatus Woesearchaeota archaeon CG10_big_fil_rev_8_21_14_0_10_34_8]|nr:MAG: acetylglutamate kinase [Candidatus Woesearchaeota archaeon CG10_big_fil_rev_8_21_14_0_10_34_8]
MIIVKVGGAAGINYDNVADDIALLVKKKQKIILVNGGKSELETISTKLGNPPNWVKTASGYTSRRTDKNTIEMFTMVYAGKMNKMIVEKLQQKGVNAVGLSGLDGKLIVAKKKNIVIIEGEKKKILRDDYTGKIIEVNSKILKILLKEGYTPVICPPAISEENQALNVDGDRLAAAIAESLKADTVIYLSNVPGLLKNKDDEKTLIKEINKKNLNEFMQYAQGTMKKKVMGAMEAVEKGVKQVVFADARAKNPLQNALKGKGTVIQ